LAAAPFLCLYFITKEIKAEQVFFSKHFFATFHRDEIAPFDSKEIFAR